MGMLAPLSGQCKGRQALSQKLCCGNHGDKAWGPGAFKAAFGTDYKGECPAETGQHKAVMEQVKAKLAKTHPGLAAEFYLMALDGKAERVV